MINCKEHVNFFLNLIMKCMQKKIIKIIKVILITGLTITPALLFADNTNSNTGLALIANNITSSLESVVRLILGICAVAGVGFGVASVFKFKQHKDNPTQIPLGQPLSLLFIAVFLLWMPFILEQTGKTVSGSKDDTKKDQATIGGQIPSWLKGDGN